MSRKATNSGTTIGIDIGNNSFHLISRNVRNGSRLCENVTPDILAPWLWREVVMKRLVEGEDRGQSTLFPERLDEYIAEDNPVRVIDVFVDELDRGDQGLGAPAPQIAPHIRPKNTQTRQVRPLGAPPIVKSQKLENRSRKVVKTR